jgi:hypothetical protein
MIGKTEINIENGKYIYAFYDDIINQRSDV